MSDAILFAGVPRFYAEIERAQQPGARGRPVIVGGDPRKRGTVQSASQDALDSGVELSAQVLKVGHHGSDTSSTEAFLEAVRPAVAVVSVGRENPLGHPTAEVMDRLRERLSTEHLYLTAEDGTIELTTDGTRWWVKTGR